MAAAAQNALKTNGGKAVFAVTDTDGNKSLARGVVITNAAGEIIDPSAPALPATAATAANQTTQITAEQAMLATLGATTGAAVTTDANGTIQQYVRGLVVLFVNFLTRLPAALGAGGGLKVDGSGTPLPVTPTAPLGGAYTDRSIASLAGTSETLMAANAARRILVIHNIGAAAIAVNLTGGAASLTVGGSVVLAAGGSLVLDHYPPTALIKVIGTATAAVTAYEG